MNIIGIVGGIGPPSTIEYYRRIVEEFRLRSGGADPRVLINRIDAAACWELVAADRRSELTMLLREEIDRLVAAGAEVGALASNSVHIVFEAVEATSPIPLVSIVDAVGAAVAGTKRLGLFATGPTMRSRIYQSALERRGVAVTSPSPEDQRFIDESYMNELVRGRFLPETRSRHLDIADRMAAEGNVDGIILAGTELPLLLPIERQGSIRFFNSTRIHVDAIIERALPERAGSGALPIP